MLTLRSSLRAAVALAVLCCAACATAPAGPGVASLGSGSASTTSATSSSGDDFTKMLAFASCMRSHGVQDFPDPTRGTNGTARIAIQGGAGSDLGPNSSVFQAAQRACQSLMPNGGPNGAKVDPTKVAPWAACIRSHGVPDFPDPTIVNGALKITLGNVGVNPGSSPFQKAMEACRSLNPGGGLMMQSGGPGGGAAGNTGGGK
jgi:hypothetical protein